MEYPSCAEPEWPTLPPLPRLKIRLAVAVSVLLHGVGLAVVAVFLSHSVDKQPAAERRLTVQLAPPKTPEAVPEPEPAVPEVEQAAAVEAVVEPVVPEVTPEPEPAAEPEPEVANTKSIHTMLNEAIRDTPALTEPPASMTEPAGREPHGTVFDPRLREKLARLKTYRRSASGEITSYQKNDGSTHVDLGNGKCFETRPDMAVDGRDIWWHTRCPNSGSSELNWGDSLR
jgi:hypothetical protein